MGYAKSQMKRACIVDVDTNGLSLGCIRRCVDISFFEVKTLFVDLSASEIEAHNQFLTSPAIVPFQTCATEPTNSGQRTFCVRPRDGQRFFLFGRNQLLRAFARALELR